MNCIFDFQIREILLANGVRRVEMKLHIIFALKYNKQQLLLLLDKITSKILEEMSPCPIGIDAPGNNINQTPKGEFASLSNEA